MQALAAHSVEAFGGLDIWVNNAGIGYLMMPLLEVSEDDWRAVIDVNLTGAFFGLQSAAEIMVEQGRGGRIINIASQAAKSGFPHAQAYTSSKHGLVGLIRSASIELGPEDYMENMKNRIPMGRPGLPEDTANAVAFLCSDEAVYITGESMNVSGGEEPH